MMKRILVPLLGQSGDRSALDAAAALLKDQGGHIEVRLYRRDPRDVLPLVGEGFSASAVQQVMEAAEKSVAEQLETAKATVSAWAEASHVNLGGTAGPGHELTGDFETVVGPMPASMISRGRLADLICFARPMAQGQPDRESLLETAMMETGKPVLMVPDDGTTTSARNIIVAWNGSKEAAHAVSMSMPLLERADKVTVITVKDGGDSADPGALAEVLATNGIKAEARVVEMLRSGVAPTLESEAAKDKADLLVIGAYSHSRMREFIMGGVTDDMLKDVGLAVLLVH